ncbi:MAG: hypothetical protein EBT51_12235, partial [Flavobacteriaceae bacterium]|nr:hypothetical protein [Flavobacteriaceae bacterium]
DIASNIAVSSKDKAPENRKDKNKLHEDMLYIDVIILRSEENSADSRGINLLNGLKLSFSGTILSQQKNITKTDLVPRKTSSKRFFSPEVGIPGINYMLNIFNNFSTKTEIIGRPTLVAMSGKKSEFHSGSELHIALTDEDNSRGRLEKIPVGVVISVEPKFASEDKSIVDLSINVERTFIESGSQLVGFGNFAQTSRNGVSANVRVAMGETLILGGLSDREIIQDGDKVIAIGDIPLLGNLFSQRQKGVTDKSVVIMMTPRRPVSDLEDQLSTIQGRGSYEVDFLGQLKNEAAWTTLDSNLASILRGFQRVTVYSRGFRGDDLPLELWNVKDMLLKIKD